MKIDLTKIPVYWINSDSAIDRAENMNKLLTACRFENHQRFPAIMHENKVIGCALSHIKALTEIKDEMFILMEDDIQSTNHLKMNIEIPDDFDAFYLGTSYWPNDLNRSKLSLMSNSTQKTKISEDLYQISYMTALHSVLYRNNQYKIDASISINDYLRNPNGNLHCDVAIAEIQKDYKIYAPSHPFFYQSGSRLFRQLPHLSAHPKHYLRKQLRLLMHHQPRLPRSPFVVCSWLHNLPQAC